MEDAIVAREHICSLCNVHRTAVTFSLQTKCLKKNVNASRPSEHPSIRGENVKTFGWDHRLQVQNILWHLNGLPDGSNIGSTV